MNNNIKDCDKDFEACKTCTHLGSPGYTPTRSVNITAYTYDIPVDITIPRCARFVADKYIPDNHCPSCGMSMGHTRHRCTVSKKHFEVA